MYSMQLAPKMNKMMVTIVTTTTMTIMMCIAHISSGHQTAYFGQQTCSNGFQKEEKKNLPKTNSQYIAKKRDEQKSKIINFMAYDCLSNNRLQNVHHTQYIY